MRSCPHSQSIGSRAVHSAAPSAESGRSDRGLLARRSLRTPSRQLLSTIALGCLAATTLAMNETERQGCAATEHTPGEEVPDTTGTWSLSYDDTIAVEIALGGSVYNETISAAGGKIAIDHEGQALEFDLDCEREDVLCPSEAWPDQVTLLQTENVFNGVQVTLPGQACTGTLVDADPSTCGAGTTNPDCDPICEGGVALEERKAPGFVSSDGSRLDVLLGVGAASNGVNCALLGLSTATAQLGTAGTPGLGDWTAVSMNAGTVTVGYAGGCLWAGDPDDDGHLEALVIGASIKFETGFVGVRAN